MISRRSFLTGLAAVASAAVLPSATQTRDIELTGAMTNARVTKDAALYGHQREDALDAMRYAYATLEKIDTDKWLLHGPGEMVQTAHTGRGADPCTAITRCAPTTVPRYLSNTKGWSAADRMTPRVRIPKVFDRHGASHRAGPADILVSMGSRP